MNVNEYSSEYIKRSQAVTGCFAMFVLFFGLTFVPLFIENSRELMVSGYLFPVLFGLEFLVLTPIYCLYFRRREGLGRGQFRSAVCLALFLCILFVQLVLPLFTGTRQTEAWSASQIRLEGHVFWLNAAMMVLAVPVYEEMIFRGCLFSVFRFWFRNNVYAAAVAVSVLFSACHLQYMDWRSFLILFLVSLILVAGRVITGGILMPVVLHMLMNATITGIGYVAHLQTAGGASG